MSCMATIIPVILLGLCLFVEIAGEWKLSFNRETGKAVLNAVDSDELNSANATDSNATDAIVNDDSESTSSNETSPTVKDDSNSTAPNETSTTVKDDSNSTASNETSATVKDDSNSTAPNETSATVKDDSNSTASNETSPTLKDDSNSTASNETNPTVKDDSNSTASNETNPTVKDYSNSTSSNKSYPIATDDSVSESSNASYTASGNVSTLNPASPDENQSAPENITGGQVNDTQDSETSDNVERSESISSRPLQRAPPSSRIKEKSMFQKQLKCVIKKDNKKLSKYGCVCSNMKPGKDLKALDKLDKCCKKRNKCLEKKGCLPTDTNPIEYKMQQNCRRENHTDRITCVKNETDKCQHKQCECDKEAILCLQKNRKDLNPDYVKLSKKQRREMCVKEAKTTTTTTSTTPEPPPATTEPIEKPAEGPTPKEGEYCADVTNKYATDYVLNVTRQEFFFTRIYPEKGFFSQNRPVETVLGEAIHIRVGLNFARFVPWHLSFEVRKTTDVSISLLDVDGTLVDTTRDGFENSWHHSLKDPAKFELVTLPLTKRFKKKMVKIEILYATAAETRNLFVGFCFKPSNNITLYQYFDDIPEDFLQIPG